VDSSDPEDESAADICDHSNELSKALKCIRLNLLSNYYISSSRTQLYGDVSVGEKRRQHLLRIKARLRLKTLRSIGMT